MDESKQADEEETDLRDYPRHIRKSTERLIHLYSHENRFSVERLDIVDIADIGIIVSNRLSDCKIHLVVQQFWQ